MLRRLIERPIAVTMSMIAIMILGIVAMRLLPVSLIPNVEIPYITVQVSDASLSARELDESVVKVLRQQLIQVSSLKDIRSETKDGNGSIKLTFEHGSNIDYLFIEVNEKIDRILSRLPQNVERPRVIKASATDIPAFYVNMTVNDDDGFVAQDDIFPVSDKFYQLSGFARQVICKRIEQLPQVAMADVSGYVTPEILIVPNRDKLKQIGITVTDFENIIKGVNIRLGNLTIRDGEYQYNVRFQSDASSKDEIDNIYIKVAGRVWQIKDLAQVYEHPQKRTGIVTSNGKDAITLAVIKQSDARMSDLKNEMNLLMLSFSKDYPDIKFEMTRDQTQLLEYSIDNLAQNILIGALLACFVILLFMQNFRLSLLVVITIPTALILSLLFFYLIGLSINIVSLSGLILGVGMMADNSIIVIDNITYRWQHSGNIKDAVVKGASEVFAPMLSSVLTTCSVFLPLIFLSGISGALFYDQAMAVAIVLFCSLGVTVTIIPVYYYLAYRKQTKLNTNKVLQKFSFDRIINLYDRILIWFFRRRWIMWAVFVVSLVGIFVVFQNIEKEKLPEMSYNDMLVNIDWNDKITVDENNRRSKEVINSFSDECDQTTIMAGDQPFILSHTRPMNISQTTMYIRSKDTPSIERIKKEIETHISNNYPSAIYGFEPSGNIFDMVFAEDEAPLVARIRSVSGGAPDVQKLNNLVADIDKAVPDISIEPVEWQEHILYVAQPEIMALYGVDYTELLYELKNGLNDNRIFTIVQGNYSVPVVLGDNKSTLSEFVKNRTIVKNDVEIPIETFLRESRGMDLVNMIAGAEGNYYPINIDLANSDIPATMDKIRDVVSADDNFEVDFSGSYFSNREMIKELSVILIISLLLLFFILASQFESLIQPLIILLEIITDIFGALLILWIFGVSVNIMSMIGIVVMCGIVINDSILKIDTINHLRKDGLSLIHAIMEAGRRRLKPIIMTSLTTIIAIVPFLVRGDMGSDLQYPLSVAIIGGMIVGTLVSIFFIPLVYFEVYKNR